LFLSATLAGAEKSARRETVVWKSPQSANAKRLQKLEEKSFEPAGLTNRIDAAWLLPSTNLYVLGPGDVIEIESLGEAAVATTVTVGPDGKIYYSLLPGTSVWGLTLIETKRALEQALQKYFRTVPDLAVNLRGVHSKNVWLLGNVQKPGLYPMQTPLTVLDAISLAGGTLAVAGAKDGVCDLKRSFIMREGQPLAVDFERLLRSGDLSQNIYLRPDDFVCLRSALIHNVYVLGAVRMPLVVPFTDKISLAAAIMSAGGTVDYAYRSEVAIVRGSLASPRVAKVDISNILKGKSRDIELEAGDIVYVPFAPWRIPAQFLDKMVRNFVRTIAVNEGYRAVYPYATPSAPLLTPSLIGGGGGVQYNPGRGY
jgi:polysaccharide biosynthesis/export protein